MLPEGSHTIILRQGCLRLHVAGEICGKFTENSESSAVRGDAGGKLTSKVEMTQVLFHREHAPNSSVKCLLLEMANGGTQTNTPSRPNINKLLRDRSSKFDLRLLLIILWTVRSRSILYATQGSCPGRAPLYIPKEGSGFRSAYVGYPHTHKHTHTEFQHYYKALFGGFGLCSLQCVACGALSCFEWTFQIYYDKVRDYLRLYSTCSVSFAHTSETKCWITIHHTLKVEKIYGISSNFIPIISSCAKINTCSRSILHTCEYSILTI